MEPYIHPGQGRKSWQNIVKKTIVKNTGGGWTRLSTKSCDMICTVWTPCFSGSQCGKERRKWNLIHLALIGVTWIFKEYRIENWRYGYDAEFIAFQGPHQSIPLEKIGVVSFWNHQKGPNIAISKIVFWKGRKKWLKVVKYAEGFGCIISQDPRKRFWWFLHP